MKEPRSMAEAMDEFEKKRVAGTITELEEAQSSILFEVMSRRLSDKMRREYPSVWEVIRAKRVAQ